MTTPTAPETQRTRKRTGKGTTAKGRYPSPAAVAAELSIRRATVLAWIQSGELGAINLAERATDPPRWRIPRETLERFLESRRAKPPALRPARRRRPPADVIQFFK
jgi:hypothetical protein